MWDLFYNMHNTNFFGDLPIVTHFWNTKLYILLFNLFKLYLSS